MANYTNLLGDFSAAGATNPYQLAQLMAQQESSGDEETYLDDAREMLGMERRKPRGKEATTRQIELMLNNIPAGDKSEGNSPGGFGGTGRSMGTGISGPLSADESAMMGRVSQLGGLIGNLGPLAGVPSAITSAFSLATTPATLTGLISDIVGLLGAKREMDPQLGMPSEVDLQSIKDLDPNQLGSIMDAIAQETAARMAGFEDRVTGPSITNSLNDIDSANSDPGADPGGIGHSAGDTGQAGYAKGGVKRSKPGKPERAVFGEGKASQRGETGIFVPEYMKDPGKQGNESEVIAAMEDLLAELKGSR